MRSQSKSLRRSYVPLTVGCSLECSTPTSPFTQVLKGGEYEPDRTATPTGIYPYVSASASDGSWAAGVHANAYIAQMVWTVNGVDISTLPEWEGKYEILTQDDLRGTLLIKRNIAPGTVYKFAFSCVIPDVRIGDNVPVASTELPIYTKEDAPDTWVVECGLPQNLLYSSIDDRLLLRDYQLGHHITPSYSEAEAMDGNQYLQTGDIRVRKGVTQVSTGYTIKVYRTESGTERELAMGRELVALSLTSITIDLRTVPHGAIYLVRVFVDGKEVCMRSICTVSRIHPPVTVIPQNDTNIYPSTQTIRQSAFVKSNDRQVINPENVLDMMLMADTAYETEHAIGVGNEVEYHVGDLLVGDTIADGYICNYYEYDYKDEYHVMVDESGNELCDENNEPLIIN